MDFLKKNRKWIGLAGCALVIIGCFLPFATVSVFGFSQSVNYVSGDGVIVIIAVVISAILLYLKKEKFSLIPSIIAAVIVIYDMINASSKIGSSSLGAISFGAGVWIIIIGLILAIGSVFLPKEK